MRELWWLLRGNVRIRLTCADPERTIRLLSRKIRMEQIERISHLSTEFTVSSGSMSEVRSCAERYGDRVEILERRGFPFLLAEICRVPVLISTVLVLILASIWLPSRILFFRVEGAETIPERRILEEAAGCGLYFAASRGDLRSEQIKNRLLEAMPELSWVGVNTQGCVATISVRERQQEPEEETPIPGNITAAIDGIVTEVTVTSGTPVCRVGDAVRAGQVLISGYTDLGLCTHAEPSQGEIYASTRRENCAVIPVKTGIPEANGETVKKYSLILGKYRINFYSDSGILHTGCGKMTQIRYLRLPGGWTLPAALVVETYTVSRTVQTDRSESMALSCLENAALVQMKQMMIAGEILRRETVWDSDGGIYRLSMLCQCHEMIGRRSSGIIIEGDANDDG